MTPPKLKFTFIRQSISCFADLGTHLRRTLEMTGCLVEKSPRASVTSFNMAMLNYYLRNMGNFPYACQNNSNSSLLSSNFFFFFFNSLYPCSSSLPIFLSRFNSKKITHLQWCLHFYLVFILEKLWCCNEFLNSFRSFFFFFNTPFFIYN